METKEKGLEQSDAEKGEGKAENTKQGSQGSASHGETSQGSIESTPEKKTGMATPTEDSESYSKENTVQAEEWGKTTQKGGDGTKRYGDESKTQPEKGGNVDYNNDKP